MTARVGLKGPTGLFFSCYLEKVFCLTFCIRILIKIEKIKKIKSLTSQLAFLGATRQTGNTFLPKDGLSNQEFGSVEKRREMINCLQDVKEFSLYSCYDRFVYGLTPFIHLL